LFSEAISFQGPGSRGTLSVSIRSYGEGSKLILSQDITDRERNDSMRRGFVANVSHEIRTPLTVLSGFIETMASLQLTEVERRRVIELMAQQTQRMQQLVGDLLTLAQLEGSPRPAADRWVPIEQVLTQVRAAAEALSAGRHSLSCGDPSWHATGSDLIAGSEAELHSAVANLVNNAIRYTPAGGSVRVLWSIRADGAGELDVRDSGIGIEREHLPRLAERFYRVDGSRSRDTGGTGLGLSIVKHVVQRHGGELEIRSEPGRGSQFKLVFPAARVRAAAAADSAALADDEIAFGALRDLDADLS
jgi:two-component system phosphate regulon sensor histidine kinase PhoR